MRIVFNRAFHGSDYSDDPFDNAADPGRLVGIMEALEGDGRYEVVTAAAATRADLLLGHTEAHVAAMEASPRRFAMASLAVGAAQLAADLALAGQPAFACVRPPGHHASRNGAWGHCTFSNVALALLNLRATGRIRSAFVVDFDAHTGDGTLDVLRAWPEAQVFNGYGDDPADYLQVLEQRLREAPKVDVLAVSAGFDGYRLDLGRLFETEDYHRLGRLLKAHNPSLDANCRFAVLEGGYYLPDLGRNVLAFCRGFE